MKAVRRSRTAPEQVVAGLLRQRGVVYRQNVHSLPGTPDFASVRGRWSIFVHGCFWHGHANCSKTRGGAEGRLPRANRGFWREKLRANRLRDRRKSAALRRIGFRVLTVWECSLRNRERLRRRLVAFLDRG